MFHPPDEVRQLVEYLHPKRFEITAFILLLKRHERGYNPRPATN
jgi:hypothetical protein